jgi:hypothetical protein
VLGGLKTLRTMGLAGVAVAATVAGCGSGAPVATAQHSIQIAVLEYRIDPTSVTTSAGVHTFVVHNYGILAHNFAITHGTEPFAHTDPIYPGSSADLTVDLPAGRYTLKSDINNQVIAMHVPLFVLP